MLYALEPGVAQAILRDGDVEDGLGQAEFLLDVDKSWDKLAVLLAPEPVAPAARWKSSPLNPLLGGAEYGEEWGYGPPRMLTPDEVKQVAASLEALHDDEVRRRYDPSAFREAGVYSADEGHGVDAGEELEHLSEQAEEVRDFYRRAAAGGFYVSLTIE